MTDDYTLHPVPGVVFTVRMTYAELRAFQTAAGGRGKASAKARALFAQYVKKRASELSKASGAAP